MDVAHRTRSLGRGTGALVMIAAAALVLFVAAPAHAAPHPVCCNPDSLPRTEGPHVFAASFSGNRLHETLTFHKAGQFVAHILSKQPTHFPIGGRKVPLGHEAAGRTHVSFRLGGLKPGGHAVVITPEHQMTANSSMHAATWVRFTVTTTGKVTHIKLITP